MKKSLKIKRIVLIVIVALLAGFLLVWGISMVRNEILTAKYGEQFEDEYKQINLLSGIEYLKVLSYGENKAEIYYVTSDRSSAVLLYFSRIDDKWELDWWDVIWSSSGSADGCVWPYLRLPR